MVSILEMYRRAYTGPVVSEKDFLVRTLIPRAEELAKEYGVERDLKEVIPTDPGIGDAIFKAAIDLLEERGLRCSDTFRVIKFSRREIKEALRRLPSEVTFGEDAERVTIRRRKTGDKEPPKKWLGPWGQSCSSPEIFLKIHQSFAQESIDGLQNGSLTHIYGRPVKIGTPDEIYATALGARLLREAAIRAGKPGMPINFDCQAMSDIAHPAILGPGGARPTDLWTLYNIYPQSTVKLVSLNRAAISAIHGNPIQAGGSGVLYGYSGGVETTAIVGLADGIGSSLLDGVWSIGGGGGRDIYGITNTKEDFWISTANRLALSRNSPDILRGGTSSRAGACTEMSLYEHAASQIAGEAGGTGVIFSATTRSWDVDCSTGLEGRWICEVSDAVAGMGLAEANELLKILVKKFEDKLRDPPVGKRFQECYDVEALTPSKEYLELYGRAKKDLEDLGIAFK